MRRRRVVIWGERLRCRNEVRRLVRRSGGWRKAAMFCYARGAVIAAVWWWWFVWVLGADEVYCVH